MQRENIKFSLGLSNVKTIVFDKYKKDFTFIVDDKKYETSRFLADFLSPIINKYHYDDETINEITIKTNTRLQNDNEDTDFFQDFLNLSTFKEEEIDDQHRKHYIEYFLQLGNINEFLRLQPEYFDDLSPSNIIDRLQFLYRQTQKQKIESDDKIQELIEYASEHFETIPKEEMKALDIEIIELIIQNERLKIEEEDSLMKFVLELYSKDRKYGVLFEYILFNNVKEETLEEFVNEFELEDLNSKIWEVICKRLLSKTERIERIIRYLNPNEIITKEHKEGDEFNGLFHYLNDKTGGNIHENGTINITSNSIYDNSKNYQPQNLVNYPSNTSYFYHSKSDISDCYVCFDLKERRVQLSSYSIKSYNGNQNSYNLKNWVIEISKDGINWTTIDEHQNDSTLNGKYITGTFKIQNEHEFSRFIRLRQTNKNWENDYYMILSSFEIYGKLQEPNSKT